MTILLNLILTFYPATFIWYSLPTSFLTQIDSFGTSGSGHFIARAAFYALIFLGCYMVIRKYVSTHGIGYRRTLANVLGVFFILILAAFVFYSILPGADIYKTPSLINQYVLKGYYPFLAVIAPLIFLFFI